MSKGKVIKMVLILGSVCASLYQAAQFIDILNNAKANNSLTGLVPGGIAPGGALAGSPLNALGADLAASQSAQADFFKRFGATSAAEPPKSKEIVVFSANGKKLTPEEAEALRKEAERNRPRAPAKSSDASGGK